MTAATRDTGARQEHIDAELGGGGVADTAERLMAEFGGHVDLSTITEVVLRCRSDLRGAPAPSMPELLERHARQRLMEVPAIRESARPVVRAVQDRDDPRDVAAEAARTPSVSGLTAVVADHGEDGGGVVVLAVR